MAGEGEREGGRERGREERERAEREREGGREIWIMHTSPPDVLPPPV